MKYIYLFLIVSLCSCKNTDVRFEISHQQNLQEVTSASGIVKLNDHYYVIGDDSPYLFKLNKKFETISQYSIHQFTDELENGRIAKKNKPDFEALEVINENEIIGVGSGSKSPERDILVRIWINDSVSVKKYKLTTFYNALKGMEIMKDAELNIEAITYMNDVLYFFNRGRNIIFSVDYQTFSDFIENGTLLPEISYSQFDLPKINGIEAGFSGATSYKNSNILVTGSVEDTENAYDDGEILGSFIGVISLENDRINKVINWVLIDNQYIAIKVESIAVDHQISDRNINVVLVTDSDGAQSLILRGNLKW